MDNLHSVLQEYFHFSRVLPAVLVLVLLWSWESISPLFFGRVCRLRHAGRNLAMAVLNGIILFFTLGLATTMLADWTAEHQFGLMFILGTDWIWRVILGILLLDCWAYLWHCANHRFSLLWRFHRVHHSDFEMDCTTSARFHFGELFIAATTRLPVILLLGLEPLTILIHETILVAVSQFHHSNISLGRLDFVLRWLIVTPAMHHIHHSSQICETNSNYASVLSVWDRLFQSFRSPEHATAVNFGLEEYMEPEWHTVAGMLTTPLTAGSNRYQMSEHRGTPGGPQNVS